MARNPRDGRLTAGQQREQITLYSPTNSTDGSVEPSYTSVRTVRAQVLPGSGGENAADNQVSAVGSWTIRMWNPGLTVTPGWRVGWGSRTLNIVSAFDPSQLGHELHLECKEEWP